VNKLVIGARASAILFDFLSSIREEIKKPFILPANVCPIVPVTFIKAKIPFIFSDITIKDMLIDKKNVLSKTLNEEISGVLFVRSYGQMNNEAGFFCSLRKINHKLIIIDDRCLCIPNTNGEDIYEEADLTLFSTGYAKYAELNYGGFAYIKHYINLINFESIFDPNAHRDLIEAMNCAIRDNTKFVFNDENWLNKVIDFDKNEYFKIIEEKTKAATFQKSKLNAIYATLLPKSIQLIELSNNWRFNIMVENKNNILKKIFDEGLFASSHYSSVSHLFSVERSINADFIHNNIINLFNDFRFDEIKVEKICRIILNNI